MPTIHVDISWKLFCWRVIEPRQERGHLRQWQQSSPNPLERRRWVVSAPPGSRLRFRRARTRTRRPAEIFNAPVGDNIVCCCSLIGIEGIHDIDVSGCDHRGVAVKGYGFDVEIDGILMISSMLELLVAKNARQCSSL